MSDTTIGRAPQGARPGRRRRLAPWAFTVAATAVSTYALDAFATAAGVLLVASDALSGLPQWQALVLVAASYVAWGAGLRLSLRANWSLLEQTGASTNVLSKAAHAADARADRARPPARRVERLPRDRAGQGGPLLRRRVRPGGRQRRRLLRGRARVPHRVGLRRGRL